MPSELPIEIDCQSVKSLLDDGEPFLLLDCREPQEYGVAKIEGAELIPMSELQQRLTELEPLREGRIIVHCHLGGRSRQVTEWLRAQGFDNAQNMTGGIDAWSLTIDSTVARY